MAQVKVRAKLIELWSRLTTFSKQKNIYLNGDDNMYPNEIERVVRNSPTASRAVNLMAKYISGKDASDIVIRCAEDIALHYGVFLKIGYKMENGKLKPFTEKVLDYTKCRLGKIDDEGNLGKIYYGDWEDKKKKDKAWYYSFSENENVVLKQIKNDAELNKIEGGLEETLPYFRGSVMYVNLTPSYTYAISLFDSVFNDCDTEYRLGLYTNTMVRGGFLGKLAVFVQGLDEVMERQVEEDVMNWLGSENSSGVFFLSVDHADDLDKILHFKQLKSQFDEKQFSETKKTIRTNILGSANNIPEELVLNSSGLFSKSGEMYKQLKQFYWEQNEKERNALKKAFSKIGVDLEFKPLHDD